jgi:hypothetical protein
VRTITIRSGVEREKQRSHYQNLGFNLNALSDVPGFARVHAGKGLLLKTIIRRSGASPTTTNLPHGEPDNQWLLAHRNHWSLGQAAIRYRALGMPPSGRPTIFGVFALAPRGSVITWSQDSVSLKATSRRTVPRRIASAEMRVAAGGVLGATGSLGGTFNQAHELGDVLSKGFGDYLESESGVRASYLKTHVAATHGQCRNARGLAEDTSVNG